MLRYIIILTCFYLTVQCDISMAKKKWLELFLQHENEDDIDDDDEKTCTKDDDFDLDKLIEEDEEKFIDKDLDTLIENIDKEEQRSNNNKENEEDAAVHKDTLDSLLDIKNKDTKRSLDINNGDSKIPLDIKNEDLQVPLDINNGNSNILVDIKKDEAKTVFYNRIKLPSFSNMKMDKENEVLLPGDIQAILKVLSVNPLVFEVDNFIDEEECDLLSELAQAKSLKPIYSNFADVQFKNAEETFKEWDINQNGVITPDEVTLLPGLVDVKFTVEDVDDMFFVLKMDKNGDGKIDVTEMKGTNFEKAKEYFDQIKSDVRRKRNTTSSAAWIWHDSDELLKYSNEGYFEKYHERISTVTGLPSEIIEESEPLQVKYFAQNQFQQLRQDSEPLAKDIPCCLYGDVGKVCRLCRYISYAIFLNDVEEGGELAFPLANHKFQNVMNNSGEWRGYYVYSQTTGNKFYFKVNITFTTEGANRVFTARGKDESGGFVFINTIIIGKTVKLEKKYTEGHDTDSKIKYHGKIIEGTKISGKWWIPGRARLRGTFFMWNRDYEIFSTRAIDESNQIECCATSSLVVKPKKGKAVFWYNHHANSKDGMIGDLNQEAMSTQCQVFKGEKWVATSWINLIGDGDLTIRAWRRGTNLLKSRSKNIYNMLGTNETKLSNEPYETEFLEEVRGTNKTRQEQQPGYYKHKPASNALQAINLLFNDMTSEQLKLIAKTVHNKLGLTCIPLTIEHAGKVSLVDGSVE